MDIPSPNELHQPYLQRWRTSDRVALGQQLSPGVGFANMSGESKFNLDDSMLSDLMDLDPLCDQTGEPWVATSSDYGFPYMAFSPSFSPLAMSPANSQTSPSRQVFSQGSPALALCSQLSPGEYLIQEALSPTLSRLPELLEQHQSSEGYLAAAMSPASRENFAELSQIYLSQQLPAILVEGRDGSVDPERSNNSTEDSIQDPKSGYPGNFAPSSSSISCVSGNRKKIELLQEDYADMLDPMSRELVPGGQDAPYRPLVSLENSRKRSRSLSLRERMRNALVLIGRNCADVLAQVWMPIRASDDTVVLSTREQPFVIEHNTDLLQMYRSVSERYFFSVAGGSPGLPGRVFLQQVPEWTPNVQFYSRKEYLRVEDAQRCDVRGTLAVPVFEASSRDCVAVIELVMRAEKVQYAPEIDIICRALQVCENDVVLSRSKYFLRRNIY